MKSQNPKTDRRLPAAVLISILAVTAMAQDAPEPIEIAVIERDAPVDFRKDVLPFLEQSCLPCHGSVAAKAGLRLDTFEFVLKGNETGPVVEPGKGDESLMLNLAAHRQEPVMPPPNNPANAPDLKPEQLGLLKLWIDQGAKAPAPVIEEPKPMAAEKGIAIAQLEREEPVDFAADILPMFQRSCLACHNATAAKAKLNLESPQTILEGSRNGQVMIPGRAEQSMLLLLAAHRQDPAMPPADNGAGAPDLSPEQLGLLKLWIDQFAAGQMEATPADTSANDVQWQPLPERITAIHAVAITSDGEFAACGRGNEIFIYDVASGRLVTQLTDPAFEAMGHAVAHRDMVNALAFSPDNLTLASGGYRQVKLWRRVRQHSSFDFTTGPDQTKDAKPENPPSPVAVALSSDGRWLAASAAENAIDLWDMTRRKLARKLAGHEGPVHALAFSTEGGRLYSGSADKTVRVWQVSDGLVTAMKETAGPVHAVIALDSPLADIASAGGDNVVRLWKMPPAESNLLESVKELAGHAKPVTALANWPGDAGQIVSASEDQSVRIWKLEDGSVVKQFDHGGPVNALAVRPDGKRLASGGANNITVLWNVESGERVAELKGDRFAHEHHAAMQAHSDFTKSEAEKAKKAYDEAQKAHTDVADRLLKATAKKQAAILKYEDHVKLRDLAQQDKTAAEQEAARAAELITQAQANKTVGDEGVAQSDKLIASIAGYVEQLQQAANQAMEKSNAAAVKVEEVKKASEAAAADALAKREAAKLAIENSEADADVKFKAAEDAKANADRLAAQIPQVEKRAAAAKEAADRKAEQVTAEKEAAEIAAAAKTAVEAARDQAQQQLDRANARKVKSDERVGAANKALEPVVASLGLAGGEQNTAINEHYATSVATRDMAIRWIDARTDSIAADRQRDQVQSELDNANTRVAAALKPIGALAFSPDNQRLAVAGDSKQVCTFDAETARPLETFEGHNGAVTALAFDDKGDLFSGGIDRKFVHWDLHTSWKLDQALGGGGDSPITDRVLALDFNPTGDLLAAAGGEPSRTGQITIWSMRDGSLVRQMDDAHSDTVFDVSFSPDGQQIATAAADRTVKIFHVGDGQMSKSFEGHTHHVLAVDWQQDGRTLISGGADRALKKWNVRTGDRITSFGSFTKEVTAVRFIGYSDQALVAAADPKVCVYQADGKEARVFAGPASFTFGCDITPDGKKVAAGGEAGILFVWDIEGKELAKFEPPGAPAQEEAVAKSE